jgi:hypothetical protein
MNRRKSLQRRLAPLERLVSGAVDCVLEARNNAARGEWDFAGSNLRTLFRNASAIARQRKSVLRAVRVLRREEPSR